MLQAMGKLRMIQPSQVSYMQVPLSTAKSNAVVVAQRKPAGGQSSKEGVLGSLLEKVAGQVQLLPLGNLGTPIE